MRPLFFDPGARGLTSLDGLKGRELSDSLHVLVEQIGDGLGAEICLMKGFCRVARRAADLGPQLDKVGKDVGLASQLIGDYRRLA